MSRRQKTEYKAVEPTAVEPTEIEPTKVEPTEVGPTEIEPSEKEPTEIEPTEGEPTYTAIAQGWDPKNREVMLWATEGESVTYRVTKEAANYASDTTTSTDQASAWYHEQIESSQNQ